MGFAASGETLFKTRCGAKDFFDSLKRHGGAFRVGLRPGRRRRKRSCLRQLRIFRGQRRFPGCFAPIFNVSPKGDPLEIYTDRDGEVIFKKYSPMGELGTFVGELAEALSRTAGLSCAICDRDAVIAAAGGAKKDIYEKAISSDLETLMEQRHIYEHNGSDETVHVSANDPYHVVVAAPIIAEGDVTGCVAFLSDNGEERATEVESKLSQTAASFLSKHVTM